MPMPLALQQQAAVAPPSYQRAQAKQGRALHLNALTLVTTLHLLMVCRLAVQLAHRRWPPPLPAGPGGAPRTSSQESLLLISLLRTRLAALLAGDARLAGELACLGSGLWAPLEQAGRASYS
jgi:hypothetical protein